MTRKSDHVVHSGLLPLRVFSDATMSDTFLTTKFPVLNNIFAPCRNIGNKWQFAEMRKFLREVASGIAVVNAGRISAPFAKEQHVGVDDEHRGQHQRGCEYGFHFKSSISNA